MRPQDSHGPGIGSLGPVEGNRALELMGPPEGN